VGVSVESLERMSNRRSVPASLTRTRLLDLSIGGCVLLLSWTIYGHFHRDSLESQIETYRVVQHPADRFDSALFDEIRSVDDAVAYIRARGPYRNETALLQATYELVRTRFLHLVYPKHDFVTNPYLSLLHRLFPERTYDTMAPADVKLRHSAGVSCGGAATTFVEIYRALGGRAQFITYMGPPGHQVAEAIADDRAWFIDADLEVIAPFAAIEFAFRSDRIARYYSHRSAEEIEVYEKVFRQRPIPFGFDGPPSGSPRGYAFQQALESAKFALPVVLGVGFFGLRRWGGRDRSGAQSAKT